MKSFLSKTSLALIASLSNGVTIESIPELYLAQVADPLEEGFETRQGAAGTSTESYTYTAASDSPTGEATCVRKTEYNYFNNDDDFEPS